MLHSWWSYPCSHMLLMCCTPLIEPLAVIKFDQPSIPRGHISLESSSEL